MENYFAVEVLALYLVITGQAVRRWVLNLEMVFCRVMEAVSLLLSAIGRLVDDNGGVLLATQETSETKDSDGICFMRTERQKLFKLLKMEPGYGMTVFERWERLPEESGAASGWQFLKIRTA